MKFMHIIGQKMKLPNDIPVWGDVKFRGKCPKEVAEQVTFFNEVRKKYPGTWGVIATHVRNEGKKTAAQVMSEKAEGMTTGASDIIIGGFYCELKRQDHTQCKISDDQIKYLKAVNDLGFYGCIALGYKSALEAFECYISTTRNGSENN